MIESIVYPGLPVLINNLAGGSMSDISKISPWIVGVLTAIVGVKTGWHIEIKGNCIGICYQIPTVSATRASTIVAEDERHHVELLPDGTYSLPTVRSYN
jgi:hypothetical protein